MKLKTKIDYFSYPNMRELFFLFFPLNLWRRRAIKSIFKILKKIKRIPNILEIGCGSGILSKKISLFLPDSSILAIDNSNKMIEKAKKYVRDANVTFVLRDFFSINGEYKLIISMHVMVLFPMEAWLDKINHILHQKGVAIVTLLRPSLFTKLHRWFFKFFSGHNIYLYKPEEAKEKAKKFNFKVKYWAIDPYEGSYLLILKK